MPIAYDRNVPGTDPTDPQNIPLLASIADDTDEYGQNGGCGCSPGSGGCLVIVVIVVMLVVVSLLR